jgi:predicted short-subunit dehydrogenase-like oxidoreductase (DUF2520 family)
VHEITIIGPGRLGGALALALSDSGSKIVEIVYRSRPRAKLLASKLYPPPTLASIDNVRAVKGKVVLITVPDDEISNVVNAIAGHLPDACAAFHTSGSLSSDELAPLRSKTCSVASIHPLASISGWMDSSDKFKRVFYCLEGDPSAIRIGQKLVSQLGGQSFSISSEHKPLYHAAALTAAGHVTSLFDMAIGFMAKAGVERRKARKLLQPLLSSVADNLAVNDTKKALTGTYARADESTMNRHLKALHESATKDEMIIYIELALRSIALADNAGADQSKLESMRKTLLVAKRKFEC